MIGDSLMIYDPVNDVFFAGRGDKVYANRKAPPLWERDPSKAKCSNALTKYRAICAEIGGGVRIVSETEARRIVMMRKYRERQ